MIPVALAEVPLLHWFTRCWGQVFSSSDERGFMLRIRELLKHTSIGERAFLSGTRNWPRPD